MAAGLCPESKAEPGFLKYFEDMGSTDDMMGKKCVRFTYV